MDPYTPPQNDSGLLAYEEYIAGIWDAYAGYIAHCTVTGTDTDGPYVPLWRYLSIDAQLAFINTSEEALDSVVNKVFAAVLREQGLR